MTEEIEQQQQQQQQQQQIESRNTYLKQDNYGFPIVDEDDYPSQEESQKILNSYKQSLDFLKDKIESQRKRWKTQITNKGLIRKLEQITTVSAIQAMREDNKDLKKLTRKGIPPELRGDVWFLISGAHARMKEQNKDNKKMYYLLLEQCQGMHTEEMKQVDADVDRTFPNHPFFNNKATQDALRNILYTYSLYNPKIGYCQSMNYLAGVLLLHMPEEHAFWTLDVILRDYMPHDLYDPTMNGLKCEVHVLSDLAADRIPKVTKHLQKLQIDFLMFSTRWFMCLYLNSVPMETAFRIWDAFFLEGYKILFRISISMLQMMEKEILSCDGLPQILKLLNQHPRELFDCRNLLKNSFKIRRFSRERIEKSRKQFRATLK